MDVKERFAGCLLGLALGDAIGAPFEGGPPGEKSLDSLPRLLKYTDDTEMAIGVAESLAEEGRFSPGDMAERFVGNFNPWRGYGPGTMAVLGLIGKGVPWDRASRAVFPQGSFGNGAAMRAAPIGLFFSGDADRLREAAYGASAITHGHPLAKEGALLIALATAEILNGRDREEVLDGLMQAITIEEYRAKLRAVGLLLDRETSAREVISSLGNSVLALESAPTALYAFLRYGGDYLETVRFCISLGGDTDTISAMAGALSGAYVGEDDLPQDLLERIEDRKRLKTLSHRLLKSYQKA
jgi:poly(ADP-ribose) glycohydrolase ARH3